MHRKFLIVALSMLLVVMRAGFRCRSARIAAIIGLTTILGQRNSTDADDGSAIPESRLETPVMVDNDPAPGRRVRVTTPEYEGTQVHHSLYLPMDWNPDGRFPVLVEYTGNLWLKSGSTGEVKDANLGFGLSGGKRFLWVVLPTIEHGGKENCLQWWGDLESTLNYCKLNVPRICRQYRGNPDQVFLCGFSRGAIAANFLGLADDEISVLWKGFITHDHYDGVFRVDDQPSAIRRLKRLAGRPQLICSSFGTQKTRDYLRQHIDLRNITFLDVPVARLFDIPDGKIIHPHTDLWMSIDSEYRQRARAWLQDQLGD